MPMFAMALGRIRRSRGLSDLTLVSFLIGLDVPAPESHTQAAYFHRCLEWTRSIVC